MIKHKLFGVGKVVRKELVGNYTYIVACFDTGKEARFLLPESFETGSVEALGSLKDEVDHAIAERKARRAAAAVTAVVSATTVKRITSKNMPSGPIPLEFERYLINEGYAVETDSGNPSTVYSYLNAVESIRVDEGISWDTLKIDIADIVTKYDDGGVKELIGAKSNRTYINALKRFEEFVG